MRCARDERNDCQDRLLLGQVATTDLDENKAVVSDVGSREFTVDFDADGRTAHDTVEYPWKSVKNETTATVGSVREDPWYSAQKQSLKGRSFGGLSRVEMGGEVEKWIGVGVGEEVWVVITEMSWEAGG